MATYKITLEVADDYDLYPNAEKVQANINDLLRVAVMQTAGLRLADLTTTKKRKG